MQVVCALCSTPFQKTASAIRRTKNHFCSRSCAATFNNRVTPKRAPEGHCRTCNSPVASTQRYCSISCRETAVSARALSPEEVSKRRKGCVVAWRQRAKLKAIAYKGGACQGCGYGKCVRSLQFHHIDPAGKDFGIGRASARSWARIQVELDKCVLLCANCHGEVHEGIRVVAQTA